MAVIKEFVDSFKNMRKRILWTSLVGIAKVLAFHFLLFIEKA